MKKLHCWKNLDRHQPITARGEDPLTILREYLYGQPQGTDGFTVGDFNAIDCEFVPNEWEAYSLAFEPFSRSWEIHHWENGEYTECYSNMTLEGAVDVLIDLAEQFVV